MSQAPSTNVDQSTLREEIQFGFDNLIGSVQCKLQKDTNTLSVQLKEAATGRIWKLNITPEVANEISKQGTKLSVDAIYQMITNAFKGEEKTLSIELFFTPQAYPLSTPVAEMKDVTSALSEVLSEKCSLVVDISLKAVFLTVKVAFILDESDRNEKVMIEELLRKNFYFGQVIQKLELKNTLLEHKYLLQSNQITELENRITELTQLIIQTLQLQKLRNLEALVAEQPNMIEEESRSEEPMDQIDQFCEACNPNCLISQDKKHLEAKETAWGTTCRLSNYVSIHNNYIEFKIEKMTEECVMFFGVITEEYDSIIATDNNVIGSSQYVDSFALSLTDKKLYTGGRSVEELVAVDWEVGDKVGMLVDFKHASLNYFKNGKLIAQAFKGLIDENKRWYFGVSLCKQGDAISIAPKDD
ncbi:predicted protein [Naegleria gruberi]|uniref:Predicted protein n=1 Tax=Naegleria gruberi TaxID=5762 RepID=D2VAM6_NAEGR|nr:uncharacterized protein NAEGRDRAFT_65911 [Naegleria gruberi]EFC45980.1 predicted protein [Naegleria gruberi]|eukprot:XP_002678724.1 predicted protein [Naegleria gruberi strain NEG-M]